MKPIQNYQILSNLFLITFKLLLLETTATFSRKPFEHLKSTLLPITAQNEAYTSHYANHTSKYANLVSENKVYKSYPINHSNITNEPYDLH